MPFVGLATLLAVVLGWFQYQHVNTEWSQETTVMCNSGYTGVYAHFERPTILGGVEKGWGYKEECPVPFLDADD